MEKKPYSLLDLIRDDDFITWVRRPTPEVSSKWEAYLKKFPRQVETLALARQYIDVIAEDTGRDVPTSVKSRKMWQEVRNIIRSENSKN